MQRWFSIHESTNIIQNTNKIKGKNHMTVSTDTEKFFGKIQHPFMIKPLTK
jgi:hypothetical protein